MRILLAFLIALFPQLASGETYTKGEMLLTLRNIAGRPRGVLGFDNYYDLIDRSEAQRLFDSARKRLARRRAKYVGESWDCEDFARYGAAEIKLYYRNKGINPAVGWLAYQPSDSSMGFHARAFVLVKEQGVFKVLTYEMTKPTSGEVNLVELDASELASVEWLIM